MLPTERLSNETIVAGLRDLRILAENIRRERGREWRRSGRAALSVISL